MGIITIFIFILFLCDPAKGEDIKPVNTWNAVHELVNGDYGVDNAARYALVVELDTVLALVKYTTDRIDSFDSENGLDNLEARKTALLELIERTNHAYKSVLRDITWFVKNHKGV